MVYITNGKVIYEPVRIQFNKPCNMCKNIGKVNLNNNIKPQILNNNLRKKTIRGIDIII